MHGNSIVNVPYMSAEMVSVPYDVKGLSILKFRDGETQAYYHKDLYTEGDLVCVLQLKV
jgi:hypothetical protein